MKSEIQKSGGSKGKILFIKDGSKKRIRFLCDAEEGMELTFHDSYSEGINALCLEGRIDGAVKFGNTWAIPESAEKPRDERIKSGKYIKTDK